MRSDCSLNSISTCTGKSQGESGTQTLLKRPQDTSIRICPARPNSHARTGIFFSFSCPADHESGSQPYTHTCSARKEYCTRTPAAVGLEKKIGAMHITDAYTPPEHPYLYHPGEMCRSG